MSEKPAEFATVRLSHVFPAPRARVFGAFTNAALLTPWIWGKAATNTSAIFDARPGHGFTVYTDNCGEDAAQRPRAGMRGLIVECVQDEKLVYTLRWDADVGYNRDSVPLDEVVTVTFHADPCGTRIEYVHMGIPNDGESAGLHAKAIATTFNDLALLLTDT